MQKEHLDCQPATFHAQQQRVESGRKPSVTSLASLFASSTRALFPFREHAFKTPFVLYKDVSRIIYMTPASLVGALQSYLNGLSAMFAIRLIVALQYSDARYSNNIQASVIVADIRANPLPAWRRCLDLRVAGRGCLG